MKSPEERITELEAIVRAQGAMLMSLITASDLLTPGIAAGTVEFAQAQAEAAQGQGENLAAYYLFSLVDQIVACDTGAR